MNNCKLNRFYRKIYDEDIKKEEIKTLYLNDTYIELYKKYIEKIKKIYFYKKNRYKIVEEIIKIHEIN
jgi:hypothetical protein